MLDAKSAAPRAESCIWLPPVLTHTANQAITIFASPPGYLVTSNLADKLLNQGREIFWLRIGPEDRDPGILLLSLAECFQRGKPDLKESIQSLMRRTPGPIIGWLPLFNKLTEDIVDVLPSNSVIVFEHMHHLCDQPSTLMLLENSLLSSISLKFPCILITHQNLPSASFPIHCTLYQPEDLKINSLAGAALAENAGIDLIPDAIQNLVIITGGRMGALQGIVHSCQILGSNYVEKIIRSAKNFHQLFKSLTHELLAGLPPDEQNALLLTTHLEYCHPDLTKAIFGRKICLSIPWGQPLNNAWVRLLCIWLPSLQAEFKINTRIQRSILRTAADFLAHQGDISLCLPLYFYLQDFESISRVLAKHSPSMLDLGQWMTLEHWLDKLPKPILLEFPTLLYVQGELQAVRGSFNVGRKTFLMAEKTFSQKQDYVGACESLLAEGTLAAWQSDLDKAQICFLKAETIAKSANLSVHMGWINWTRGYFSSIESNPGEALQFFDQTFETIRDPALVNLYQKAEKLLEQQKEILQEQENLYQTFQKLSQSKQEISRNLASLLKSPSNRSPIINSLGWTRTPLILKIPAPSPEVDQSISGNGTTSSISMNFMSSLTDLVHRIRKAFTNGKTDDEVLADSLPLPIEHYDQSKQNKPTRKKSKDIDPGVISSFVEIPAEGIMIFNQAEQKNTLSAQLLGSCRISLDNHTIEDQISGRSLAVFQYLLFHHAQKQHREILMSVFWPDTPPDSARNNLNVALHNLRQVFRKVTDLPVIEFHNGAYHFNPKLQIWLDVDDFEQHIQAGFANEQSGAVELATQEYEIGVNLYQDDFLVDDPYEEWALAPRERLRITYLNGLGSLGQIYFSQEQYPACVALCQRILERDNCREDTHSLLMRCYSRLGQRSLALRQFQVCVDALQSELGVNPEVETKQLAEHIRKLGEI